MDAACDKRCLRVPSGEPREGDTELTEAPRGGKPGGIWRTNRQGQGPGAGRRPGASGTFPQPAWLAGVSGGRVGGRGHSTHSVPLDWSPSARRLHGAGRAV